MSTVLLLSVVVVVAAGLFHLYSVILQLLHKTPVQNKVVLITDTLSALGNGMLFFHVFPCMFPLQCPSQLLPLLVKISIKGLEKSTFL